MKFREIVESIKQSEICKLKADGKIIGLRVKLYNVQTNSFDYYDFETSIISNQGVRNFVNGLKMNTIELKHVNGLLMSDDEINGSISVGNFLNEADAMRALQPFIRIYKIKEIGYVQSD